MDGCPLMGEAVTRLERSVMNSFSRPKRSLERSHPLMLPMRRSPVPMLLGLLLVLAGCSPSSESNTVAADLTAAVDAIFSEFSEPGSPGAAVSVIRNGEVVLARGYGLADLEAQTPIERTTPFRLGSVGKQFTSMAVMLLADEGALAFDDPAETWVPELHRFPGITVRHLLNHTGGLPDYYSLPDSVFMEVAGVDGNPLLTNADAVSIYETWGDPVFAPGDQYEYSNPGYEVLALIVERITGQTFGEVLAEKVFRPLEMRTAAVRERPETVIPARAVGYRSGEEDGAWEENDDHFANWLTGAGGVYASLDDLYLWDQALYTEDLVSREILDEAFTPTTLNDGTVSEYGFGWNLSDRLGRRAVHHGGSWVGFRAAILRFIDDELTVVVLSNASASSGEMANEVAELFLAP